MVFGVIADGEFHDYALDLSTVTRWVGVIKRLRIDSAATGGFTVDIDHITFPG